MRKNSCRLTAEENSSARAALTVLAQEGGAPLVVWNRDERTTHQSVESALAELGQTGEDLVRASSGSFIWLVWGNDPAELLADYSTDLEDRLSASTEGA